MKKGKNKEKKFVISQLLKEVKHKQPSTISNKVSYTITQHIYSNTDYKDKNIQSELEPKNIDEYMKLVRQAHHKFNPENEQVVQQTINSTVKEIGRHEHNHVFLDNIIKNSEVHVHQTKPLAIPKSQNIPQE